MKSLYQIALLAALLVIALICKNADKKRKRIINVGGIEISYKPCEDALTQLFGKGIDLNKACPCIYESYYDAIKNDSPKLNEFERTQWFDFKNLSNDSISYFYKNCLINNIVDTKARISFSDEGKSSFKKSLQDKLGFDNYLDSTESQNVYDCIIEKISHITIKDYLTSTDSGKAIIPTLLDSCTRNVK